MIHGGIPIKLSREKNARQAYVRTKMRLVMGYLNRKLWSVLLCIWLLRSAWACGRDAVVSFFTASDSVLCVGPSLFGLGRH